MENLGRALEGEEHHAGIQILDGIDGDIDRRDDAEVAVAAAQRPEEIRLVLCVDTDGRLPAVTSSIAVTLFAWRPCFRPSQPMPPPSE